jgi:hypothetical protein
MTAAFRPNIPGSTYLRSTGDSRVRSRAAAGVGYLHMWAEPGIPRATKPVSNAHRARFRRLAPEESAAARG